MAGPSRGRKVGMSRRELEWIVNGMVRDAPADPARMARFFGEVLVSIIDKNNQAIARDLAAGRHADDGEGH